MLPYNNSVKVNFKMQKETEPNQAAYKIQHLSTIFNSHFFLLFQNLTVLAIFEFCLKVCISTFNKIYDDHKRNSIHFIWN